METKVKAKRYCGQKNLLVFTSNSVVHVPVLPFRSTWLRRRACAVNTDQTQKKLVSKAYDVSMDVVSKLHPNDRSDLSAIFVGTRDELEEAINPLDFEMTGMEPLFVSDTEKAIFEWLAINRHMSHDSAAKWDTSNTQSTHVHIYGMYYLVQAAECERQIEHTSNIYLAKVITSIGGNCAEIILNNQKVTLKITSKNNPLLISSSETSCFFESASPPTVELHAEPNNEVLATASNEITAPNVGGSDPTPDSTPAPSSSEHKKKMDVKQCKNFYSESMNEVLKSAKIVSCINSKFEGILSMANVTAKCEGMEENDGEVQNCVGFIQQQVLHEWCTDSAKKNSIKKADWQVGLAQVYREWVFNVLPMPTGSKMTNASPFDFTSKAEAMVLGSVSGVMALVIFAIVANVFFTRGSK